MKNAPVTRLSWSDVYPILESWNALARIELRSGIYDGDITGLSLETGELEFLGNAAGEGTSAMKFELRDAAFERFENPGEWAEIFIVFPDSGPWFLLRKWK